MGELQQQIVEEMGVAASVDPAAEITRRSDFLADYAQQCGSAGFVLGISGGVDSTLAGYLSQLAAQKLRDRGVEATFHAMRLPHNVQHDEDDAARAVAFINADVLHTFNIGPAVAGLDAAYTQTFGVELQDYHRGNTKARIRMSAQYAVAGEHNALVVGTDHGAESITGFFTKFGDGGADILPNFGLNKRQIRQILKHLGADEQMYSKAPTADLLDETPGQLDETELGITYDDIDDYLENRTVDPGVAEQLENRYLKTRHKRSLPVTILDTWWR